MQPPAGCQLFVLKRSSRGLFTSADAAPASEKSPWRCRRLFQMNSSVLLCQRKAKHNSARNAICVTRAATIKTSIYNEGNSGLMKRLRQSFADPPDPHMKRRAVDRMPTKRRPRSFEVTRQTRHLLRLSRFHFDNPRICAAAATPRRRLRGAGPAGRFQPQRKHERFSWDSCSLKTRPGRK